MGSVDSLLTRSRKQADGDPEKLVPDGKLIAVLKDAPLGWNRGSVQKQWIRGPRNIGDCPSAPIAAFLQPELFAGNIFHLRIPQDSQCGRAEGRRNARLNFLAGGLRDKGDAEREFHIAAEYASRYGIVIFVPILGAFPRHKFNVS